MGPADLPSALPLLESQHGDPGQPAVTDPFEQVVWEICAYLVNDERRQEVFDALRDEIGLTPQALAEADPARVASTIARGGMHPDHRARKLRTAAATALDRFGGDLRSAAQLPLREAVRAFKRFPGIGEPGAEKILLHAGRAAGLAPESNALRVLVRLGIAPEGRDYSATYRAVRKALAGRLPEDAAWLAKARALLRLHGQRVCRNSAPACGACLLEDDCAWAQGPR